MIITIVYPSLILKPRNFCNCVKYNTEVVELINKCFERFLVMEVFQRKSHMEKPVIYISKCKPASSILHLNNGTKEGAIKSWCLARILSKLGFFGEQKR